MTDGAWVRVAASPEERQHAQSTAQIHWRFVAASCLFLAIPGACLTALSAFAWTSAGWVVGTLSVLIVGAAGYGLTVGERTLRADALTDWEQGEVEQARFEAIRALTAAPGRRRSRRGKLCVFLDVGDDRVVTVVLPRNQLWAVFGLSFEQMEAATDDKYINDLAPPHSFPAQAFTVRRLPKTGMVTLVQPEGPYLEPEPIDIDLHSMDTFGVRVIKGSLDRIEHVLAALES